MPCTACLAHIAATVYMRRKPKSMPRAACTPHMFSPRNPGVVLPVHQQMPPTGAVSTGAAMPSVLLSAETSRSDLRQTTRQEKGAFFSRHGIKSSQECTFLVFKIRTQGSPIPQTAVPGLSATATPSVPTYWAGPGRRKGHATISEHLLNKLIHRFLNISAAGYDQAAVWQSQPEQSGGFVNNTYQRGYPSLRVLPRAGQQRCMARAPRRPGGLSTGYLCYSSR